MFTLITSARLSTGTGTSPTASSAALYAADTALSTSMILGDGRLLDDVLYRPGLR